MESNGRRCKTILVVDDEPEVVLGTCAVLEADGYRTLAAGDGAEALRIIETHRPDLVILDVLMPRMDGWETLRRIQASDHSRDIPVVMLTALDQPRHIGTGIDLGCAWYYTKPITNDEDFTLLVRRILDTFESSSHEIQDC